MDLKPGYKQTEVGVIPEDWEVRNLTQVSRKITDGDHVTPRRVSHGYYLLSARNVLNGRIDVSDVDYVDVAEYQRMKQRCGPETGDVLISCSGTIGRVTVVPPGFECVLVRSAALVKIDHNIADGAFLQFWLQGSKGQKQIASSVNQGAQPNLFINHIERLTCPYPSLPEQHAIATVLSDVDALLDGLDRLIAKKRDLKQATMQQLLTGQTRLPGDWVVTSGYKQTEVGMIPEDWEVMPLAEVISEFRGGAPLKPSDFTTTGIKVLPKGGVGRTGWLKINKSDLQYCSESYAIAHRNNQVDETYTIVVLRDLVPSGPSIGLIVQIERPETYVLAQGVYGFKVDQRAESSYLVQLSNTQWYRNLMNSIMVGSTQVHITNTAFKSAKAPFPALPEQTAIAAILSDMDAELSALEQRRTKTRALKQGMMQELLTGNTRLVES